MNKFEKKYLERQEYLNGLKQAISSVVDADLEKMITDYETIGVEYNEEDSKLSKDDLFLIMKFLSFLYKICMPLIRALQYHYAFNFEKYFESDEFINHFNKPLKTIPDWVCVFESIIYAPKKYISFCISQIDCTNEKKSDLFDCINQRDKNKFLQIVSSMGKESSILVNAASLFKYNSYDIKDIINFVESGHSYQEFYQACADDIIDYLQSEFKHNYLEKYDTILNVFKTFDLSWDKSKESYGDFMLLYLSSRYDYLEHKEEFPIDAQRIIDQYIKEPTEIDFYNELNKRGWCYKIVDDNEDSSINFDDIEIFNINPSTKHSEYFNGIDVKIVSEGDEKFKQFVDYIADAGYIENTDSAKQLFTYRLTGRCRPNGELSVLRGNGGEKNSANELIFIVRYATDNSKDKYNKMIKFFVGPRFPSSNISACADQAKTKYRQELHSLYPDVFKIKDISNYGL